MNNWDEEAVLRVERTWGNKRPQYVKDAYEFLTADGCHSFIDLGCGLGRFVEYLHELPEHDSSTYIGFDSSEAMLGKARSKYQRDFVKADILSPIDTFADGVLCQATLIHLPVGHQKAVLGNIASMCRKRATFDINQKQNFNDQETKIKLGNGIFRMTWNNLDTFWGTVRQYFPFGDYFVCYKGYPISRAVTKTQFFVEKCET